MVGDTTVIFALLSFFTLLSVVGAIVISRRADKHIKNSRDAEHFRNLDATFDRLRELRIQGDTNND